ncbi:SRPBCC family protein [Myxococcus sp. CA051A]|uniref:SRPBCC family protein n=1 Tax=Myxococcus sp. CA051A TaxID=2741739 RepID=UPI00157B8833|nr:SRPBCC family protein [Myxococcus sp. CA051A]NTX63303.1 SRPBCC family protein [Myxococcus sp. CA051A]
MHVAFYLLLAIGLLGAFDVLYFHLWRGRLHERPECQREVLWHTARHLIYALQFLWVPHVRFQGWALGLLGVLYAADVFVALADVWEERDSRASQGGVPRGEYFMHVVLSVLVGLYLMATFHAVWADRLLPTGLRVDPPLVPVALRALMTVMGVTALIVFAKDLARWFAFRRRPVATPFRQPRLQRIVAEVFIPAPVEVVWERTQDPALHTAWDVRFTSIRYLPEADARGFHLMDYRTHLGFGLEIIGWGRYLANTPHLRSTFEFGSEDWRSIILRGRGVWLYEQRPGGTFFKTVFDYRARYGVVGEVLDAVLFRPVMRLGTEWGFETLRQWCAGDEHAPTRGRSRWRFGLFILARVLGRAPAPGAARSWLGRGVEDRESTTAYPCGELVEVSS